MGEMCVERLIQRTAKGWGVKFPPVHSPIPYTN